MKHKILEMAGKFGSFISIAIKSEKRNETPLQKSLKLVCSVVCEKLRNIIAFGAF